MSPTPNISNEFKDKLLGVCRTRKERDFLLNAFKANDLTRVKEFLAKDCVDVPAFWKIKSARSVLRRLEHAEDVAEVIELKNEVEDFRAFLETEEGQVEHDDPSVLEEARQLVVALEISMQHQGAHIQLCHYLASIVRSERKQSIQQALHDQKVLTRD